MDTKTLAADATTRLSRADIAAMRDMKPKTDGTLLAYIERYLGFALDSAAVCPGHLPMAAVVADAFFDRFQSAVVVGSRGSGKTTALSVLDHMNSRFRGGCHTVHVAAALRQAQLGYDYVRGYLRLPHFKDDVATEPTQIRTAYRNGSEVSIVPGTIGGTSGPHPARAVLDEADLAPWEVVQQFYGMPMSAMNRTTGEMIPQQTIITSAFNTNFGTMSRIVREATGNKALYTSCVFESLQGCRTCPDAEAAKRRIVSNPPHCPLWEQCGGRARGAQGHVPLSDILHRFAEVDEQTWTVQYLCGQGSGEGLVVPNWSDENVTEDAEYKRGAGPTFWCWDSGFTVPFALLWGQLLPNGDVTIFDEIYVANRDITEVLELVYDPARPEPARYFCRDADSEVERGPYRKPVRSWGDAAAPEVGHQITKRAKVTDNTCAMKVLDRLMLTRFYALDNRGRRRLKVHPRCRNLIEEIQTWHRKQNPDGTFLDEPADNQRDHAVEALGRALYNIEQGGLPTGYDYIGIIGEPRDEQPAWMRERRGERLGPPQGSEMPTVPQPLTPEQARRWDLCGD